MGGTGSGRPTKEMSLVKSLSNNSTFSSNKEAIATFNNPKFVLPNHSGVDKHKDIVNNYLKLDCSNDPLTNDLEIQGKLTLPQENTVASPTLKFGDGDTGFYERGDDDLAVSIQGVNRWRFYSDAITSGSTGAHILATTPSATAPSLCPSNADINTGIGTNTADSLSLIAGGVNGMELVEDSGNIEVEVNGKILVNDNTINDIDSSLTITKSSAPTLTVYRNNIITIPDYSTILSSSIMDNKTVGWLGLYSTANLTFNGFSRQDSTEGMYFSSYLNASPSSSVAAITFRGAKHNGSTSATALASSETLIQFKNWSNTRLTMLGNGDTGWGTTTPSCEIHLDGSYPEIRLDSTQSAGSGFISFYTSAGRRGYMQAGTSDMRFAADTGFPFKIYSNNTFNVEVDTSGNLKIVNDNAKLLLGSGDDCSILYDGTDMIINSDEVGSGSCKINSLEVRNDGTIKPVSMADASAANDSIYYSTTASKLVYKDSGGSVNNLY